MIRRVSSLLAWIVFASAAFAATEGGAIPVPLPLFPTNNWWNTDVSAAPLDPNSANFINYVNARYLPTPRALHPDFGATPDIGFPFILVDGSQPKKTVTFINFGDQSDGVNHITNTPFPFYPIPDEAITTTGWVEGGDPGNVDNRSTQDRHMLIVDTTNNTLYELYNVWYNGTSGNWEAGSGAFFNMNTNNRRPDTWTSADAAGLAILPGLVRYDEVSGPNEINHAFRFTVFRSNGYVYPASHSAGSTAGALPMGARLRLKANKDISMFPASVQKIFRAFKKYGLIVADNGSDMFISGTSDPNWDNNVLNPAFGSLNASDFEVVQLGWKPPVSLVISVPAVFGSGEATNITVTAYDQNYAVATGYLGTIHFASTDGSATLPLNYTFTTGDAGSHTFSVTFQTLGSQTLYTSDTSDATITGFRIVAVGPPTPASLSATAATATQVNLTWTASTGAAHYDIQRTSAGVTSLVSTAGAGTTYSDTTVAGNTSYLYKVRAVDSLARVSPFSAPDAATTMFFTDDPIAATITAVRAIHITELRQAVNDMRAAASLSAAVFTDGVPTVIKALHVQQLRSALDQARTTLGLPPLTYTDAVLTGGTTIVKAAHVQELRTGVK